MTYEFSQRASTRVRLSDPEGIKTAGCQSVYTNTHTYTNTADICILISSGVFKCLFFYLNVSNHNCSFESCLQVELIKLIVIMLCNTAEPAASVIKEMQCRLMNTFSVGWRSLCFVVTLERLLSPNRREERNLEPKYF